MTARTQTDTRGAGRPATRRETNQRRDLLATWLLLAAVVIVVDQLTKLLVVKGFKLGERKPMIGNFFDLTLAYNPGAAFSFLAGAGGWQRWLFIVLGLVAAGFIIWLLVRHRSQHWFAAGLSLILGGAIGNVIDRIARSQVVDFFLFYWGQWSFPAFNIADSAITVGAVLLIIDELRRVLRGSHD